MTRTAPSTIIAALAVLALLGVALVAGCTTTPSGPATTPTPAGTAAATVSTTGTPVTGSTNVAAVSYDRLIPFIPKTAGAWSLDGEAQGMTMKDNEGRDYTWVTGEFVKAGDENAGASIVIQDAAVANTPFKQQWTSFQSYESTEGWWRAVTVKGQPGWRFHDKSSNDYGGWVMAGDRYIVFISVEDGTEADLDALVNAVDFAGLAAVR